MKRLSVIGLLSCLAPLLLTAATDRIIDPVDVTRTAARGRRHPQAIPQNDRGAMDASTELQYVTMILQPAPGLEAFLAEQQTPGAPNYHRWLTPEQFAGRFGLSNSDIGKLTSWLQASGLTVHDVARGRHWITFSGSTDRVGRALHTAFHRYDVKGRLHFANSTEPAVPAAFANVIAGFHGLDDFEPESLAVKSNEVPQFDSTTGGRYLAPDDFATVYDIKPLYAQGIDGTGVNLAVIGASDVDPTYTQAFRSYFNLPANDVEMKLYGANPGKNGAELEAYLDLQWSGAVARGAHIIYVYSASVYTAAQYAIDQNLAPIITFSFGGCEQDATVYRSIAQQANAQGITWVAASGDAGAATCDYMYSMTPQAALGPTADGPASFPEITAVGGTQFEDANAINTYWSTRNDANHASALSYIPETVWNSYSTNTLKDAASGAASAFYAKPWWQIGTVDDKLRDMPDVSLSATRYLVAVTSTPASGVAVVGGTSASSPSFAGVLALLTQYLMQQKTIAQPGLGNINPTLYRLAQSSAGVFHDVTTGDNTVPCVQSSPKCVNGMMGFAAVPGYDLATGIGTIDAAKLVTQWTSGVTSQTSVSANATTVTRTATVHLTATVTGGGTAIPTGTAMFMAGESVLGTVNLTAGTGSATAALDVPGNLAVFAPVYATYSGDAVYSGSSGSVTIGLDTAGGHSVVVPFVSPNPVPQSSSGTWPYTVWLSEKAGVDTRMTSFTVNGVNNNGNIAALNNGVLPGHGTLFTRLNGSLTSAPLDRTFVFGGQDADGTTWTQQITVTFTGPEAAYTAPAITLATTPSSIQQNPQADSACQWKQDFTLDEHAGFLTQLTRFTVGSNDLTGQIQSIFGTTRLAPYGSLHGTMCWPGTGTVVGSSKTFTITGAVPTGLAPTATVTAFYQAPAATTAAFSASPTRVELAVADNAHNAAATVDLAFSGAAASWQAAVLPANSTTSWLKIAPLAGTASGPVSIQVDTSGLSNGAYQATIAVSAPGAIPNYLNIPVVLVVGASSTKIAGVVNAASFQPVYAPGMLAAVFGTALSSVTGTAGSIPLPLKSSGVSATVNGISAPIWGTYPDSGQVNLQVPYEAGSGPALLAIKNNGVVSYYSFEIAAAAPGLFGIWGPGGTPLTSVQQGQVVVAYITGDGDVSPFLPTGATPSATTVLRNLPKARLPLTVSVGGVDTGTPLFYGTPSGFVGVTQINFTVPANAPLGKQDVVVTVGGAASNPVTLTVTAAK